MRSAARRCSARAGSSSSCTTAARGRGTRARSITTTSASAGCRTGWRIISSSGTADRPATAQIEIGDRWRRQINGGHVHSDYLNNISLGICLVGDFNRDQPTRAQLEATEELVKYLRERCGRVDGRAIGVRPHREMNPPRWATDCPGDAFPVRLVPAVLASLQPRSCGTRECRRASCRTLRSDVATACSMNPEQPLPIRSA